MDQTCPASYVPLCQHGANIAISGFLNKRFLFVCAFLYGRHLIFVFLKTWSEEKETNKGKSKRNEHSSFVWICPWTSGTSTVVRPENHEQLPDRWGELPQQRLKVLVRRWTKVEMPHRTLDHLPYVYFEHLNPKILNLYPNFFPT